MFRVEIIYKSNFNKRDVFNCETEAVMDAVLVEIAKYPELSVIDSGSAEILDAETNVEGLVRKRGGYLLDRIKRVSHFNCFADITRARPEKLAQEYASLLACLKIGDTGEFHKTEDLVRYMKVVSAIGFFQYSDTFAKHLADAGVAMCDVI